MSLVSLALRTATIEALRGATFADGQVFDSAIQPLDELVNGNPVPLIVVSIDDSETRMSGLDFLSADLSLDLVIEMAVATFVRSAAPEGDDIVDVTIPYTDEGLEWTLDLMERQIDRRFADDGLWPGLWRDLACKCTKRVTRRGADSAKGAKFAARQIVLTLSPAQEPVPGATPAGDTIFGRFLAALYVSGLAAQAPLLRKVLIGEALPPWRQAAALLGIGPAAAEAIGLSPEEADITIGLDIGGAEAAGGDAALPPEPTQ